MKQFYIIVLLMFCCMDLAAKDRGVSLNEAVNQAKSQGKVLSARTFNGQHEIKVLTKNGTVKTINKKANRASKFAQNSSDHSSPQTWHNRFRDNPLPTQRYDNNSNTYRSKNRNVMKIEPRNSRSSRSAGNFSKNQTGSKNRQPTPSNNRSSSNSKDNDN